MTTSTKHVTMRITREPQPTKKPPMLKPCPFCAEDGTRNDSGLKPELVRIQTVVPGASHPVEFGVECYRCGARTIDCLTMDDAVKRWNMRPSSREHLEDEVKRLRAMYVNLATD